MESFKHNICSLFNIVPMASFSITGTFWIEYSDGLLNVLKNQYIEYSEKVYKAMLITAKQWFTFSYRTKNSFSQYINGDMLLCDQIDFHTDLFILRGIQIDSLDSMTTLVQKINNNFVCCFFLKFNPSP